MGTSPYVTIVMPTYNQARYLRESVDSILNQTFTNFKLVIVDDCSTDETPTILTEYRNKDSRISVVTMEQNSGTGAALNAGFAFSHTEYETWWASDNFMHPLCLETLVSFLDNTLNCDFVYAGCDILEEDGSTHSILDEVVTQQWDRSRLISQCYLGIVWLWKRALRIKAGPYQVEPCEDYDMHLKMVLAGGRVRYYGCVLGTFRRHSASMTAALREGNTDWSKWIQDKYREVWG